MYPMIPLYPMIPNILKLANDYPEPPTVYALLNSYVNFSREVPVKISDLAKTGRAMFFDFDYPLADGINRETFETMILNHFLMRRIGYETVTAFKIALNVKMNEIMPMYNKLFLSIENWNLFNDGETINRTSSDNSLTNTSMSNMTTNTNTSDRRYSNTPENKIANVQDGEYVSEYNYDQDTGSSGSNTISNASNSGNQTETITRSPADKMALYSQFLQSRQNIYTMIFKDLDSLFYQII